MIGGPLLWAGAILATLALAWPITKRFGLPDWQNHILVASSGATILAFLSLLWAYISADVSIAVVHLYTATDVALHWRISGTWTSRQGSLLMWAMYALLVTAIYAKRANNFASKTTARALLVLALPLVWMASLQDTFAATPQFLLDGQPNGNGINPTLKSWYILIHPPLMFLGYALAAVPAAAAIGHLWTGHGKWAEAGGNWTRVGWAIYTVAMGLGGIWAYVTLTFGGYWAWDPVEVANLLPWLAFSLYLHVQMRSNRGDGYHNLGPLMALLPWWLTLFSTLSTRSGLWVSVHAFTDPANTFDADPVARFLDILQADASLRPYVGLMLASAFFVLGAWSWRTGLDASKLPRRVSRWIAVLYGGFAGACLIAPMAAWSWLAEAAHTVAFGRTGYGLLGLCFAIVLLAGMPLLFAQPGETKRRHLGHKTLAGLAILVLGTGLLVMWIWHGAASMGWSTGQYEARLPMLAIPPSLAIFLFQVRAARGPRIAIRATIGLAIVAAVMWLLKPLDAPADYQGLIVVSAAAALASFDNLRHATGQRGRATLGASALLLGALLNVIWWADPAPIFGFTPTLALHIVGLIVSVLGLLLAALASVGKLSVKPATIAVAICCGFYIAPLLAAAGLFLLAGSPPRQNWRACLRKVGVAAIHLAVGLAITGYAISTGLGDEQTAVLTPDAAMTVGPYEIITGNGSMVGQIFATQLHSPFTILGGNSPVESTAIMDWEARQGAFFPQPSITRFATGDMVVRQDIVMISGGPSCQTSHAINAYTPGLQPCVDDSIAAARLTATYLPGLDLVWSALILWPLGIAAIIAASRQRFSPTDSDHPA